jgi:hypothetical protein
MKGRLYTTALFIAAIFTANMSAQNENKIMPCATYEAMEMHFAADPSARARFEASQLIMNAEHEAARNNKAKAAATQYTIPVVFHILHQGGPENVSDATVEAALQWVNDDYARANADASLTAAPFNTLYINCDIKFMLAHKDPNGNCTNGIVRYIDSKTLWDQTGANSSSYYTHTWAPTKYLNVYLVSSIVPQGTVTGGGIIVGYTYIPGTNSTGSAKDAIVYNSSFLTGSSARDLAHEIGHWLNLSHTWGNSNSPGVACGNDNVNDTPPTKGNFTGCPSSLSGNTCAGSNGLDNIQNIMNYSGCPINFTTDQKTRMRTAAAGSTSGRQSVISATNLAATDVNGTASCAPVCEWVSTNKSYTVCSGANLTMKDCSYNATIATYAWDATGANVLTPNANQTAITFTAVGTSIVTETVTNGQGSSVRTRTITVLDGSSPLSPTYNESFEAAGLPANWSIVNPNNGTVTWTQTGLGASNGGNSYFIEGASDIAGQMDYLYMPNINPMAMADNTLFTIDYAYARSTAANNDKFEIQVSTDCGGTWSSIVSLNATTMQNGSGGTTNVPYVPQSGQWKTIDIGNNPNWGLISISPSVKMRFMFQEDVGGVGFGNRFFLDNLNFSTSVGSNELTRGILFRMAPNPTTGEAKLYFTLSDAAFVKVEVQDIMGRNVLAPKNYNLQPGEQNISVNTSNTLSKGMYFVNMEMNGTRISRKLIIE